MSNVRRECCNYCMWYGPVKKDGTMRKHYRRSDDTRKQVPQFGVCEGSGKPFANLGPEPVAVVPEPCGTKLLKLTGSFTACTLPKGHDKAHRSV